ncbi:hypothetical protein F6456_05640 [Streptomyces sp. LBUM 1484]|nr:hypothetical protein [Streptomyces sp. LBUM 1484]
MGDLAGPDDDGLPPTGPRPSSRRRRRGTAAAAVPLTAGVTSSDFAVDVMENCRSEFLAIASMAIPSIVLRRRGSPESEPVGAAHTATGVEG